MSSKQIAQSLVHKNCQIPYVIGSDYNKLTENSEAGIFIARDSGRVIFRGSELILVFYDNLNRIEVKDIPEIKKTSGVFASSLRYCLSEGDSFQKGQVIFNYDEFIGKVPSFGYNVMTGYFNFFGFNKAPFIETINENLVNSGKL
ncbi:MAG: hypothetical protein K9H48_07785 [Melioribacteraceae bacterium]|nr:hypothetical protein [Melioribacteraceae bacterium]